MTAFKDKILSSTQDHMIGYGTLSGGGFNTYKGGLLRVSQFATAWAKDEYCDYLTSAGGDFHTVSTNLASSTAADNKTSDLNTPQKSKGPASSRLNISTNNNTANTQTVSTSGPSSLMSKLMRSKSHSPVPQNNNASNSTSNTPSKRSSTQGSKSTGGSVLFLNNEDEQASAADRDVPREEALHNLLHESIEKRENFTVQTDQGDVITVTIRDDDKLGDVDSRIVPEDLRRLLSLRPDLAAMLYESLLEEGIIAPYKVITNNAAAVRSRSRTSSASNGVSVFGDNNGQSQGRNKSTARGQSLSLSDLMSGDEGGDDGRLEDGSVDGDGGAASGGESKEGGVDMLSPFGELDALMDGLVTDDN
eukprot:gene34919-43059_t